MSGCTCTRYDSPPPLSDDEKKTHKKKHNPLTLRPVPFKEPPAPADKERVAREQHRRRPRALRRVAGRHDEEHVALGVARRVEGPDLQGAKGVRLLVPEPDGGRGDLLELGRDDVQAGHGRRHGLVPARVVPVLVRAEQLQQGAFGG